MKKRQRKKWGWEYCAHLKWFGSQRGFPYLECKQNGCECATDCCQKLFVSKSKKKDIYERIKYYERFEYAEDKKIMGG